MMPRYDVKNLRCLWDSVLIKVDRGGVEETTAAGIIKPMTAHPGHRRQGEIVAVGPGKSVFHDGAWLVRPMSLQRGQVVSFEIGSGTVYPLEGVDYILLAEEQVTGIFPSEAELRAEQAEKDEAWARARSGLPQALAERRPNETPAAHMERISAYRREHPAQAPGDLCGCNIGQPHTNAEHRHVVRQ